MRQVPRNIRSHGSVVDANDSRRTSGLLHADRQVISFAFNTPTTVEGEPFTVNLDRRSTVAITVDARPLFISRMQAEGGDITEMGDARARLDLIINGEVVSPISEEQFYHSRTVAHAPRLTLFSVTTQDSEVTIIPRITMLSGGPEALPRTEPPEYRLRAWNDDFDTGGSWQEHLMLIDEDYVYVGNFYDGFDNRAWFYRYPRESIYEGFLETDPGQGDPSPVGSPYEPQDPWADWDPSYRTNFGSGWDRIYILTSHIAMSGDYLWYATGCEFRADDPISGASGLILWRANKNTADLKTGINQPHNFDPVWVLETPGWDEPGWASYPVHNSILLCADPENSGAVWYIYTTGGFYNVPNATWTILKVDIDGTVLEQYAWGPMPYYSGVGSGTTINQDGGFDKDRNGVWWWNDFTQHNHATTPNRQRCYRFDFTTHSIAWIELGVGPSHPSNWTSYGDQPQPVESQNADCVWVLTADALQDDTWTELKYENGTISVVQQVTRNDGSGRYFWPYALGSAYWLPAIVSEGGQRYARSYDTEYNDCPFTMLVEDPPGYLVTTQVLVGNNTEDDCTIPVAEGSVQAAGSLAIEATGTIA